MIDHSVVSAVSPPDDTKKPGQEPYRRCQAPGTHLQFEDLVPSGRWHLLL
jgi:hypothetical protein